MQAAIEHLRKSLHQQVLPVAGMRGMKHALGRLRLRPWTSEYAFVNAPSCFSQGCAFFLRSRTSSSGLHISPPTSFVVSTKKPSQFFLPHSRNHLSSVVSCSADLRNLDRSKLAASPGDIAGSLPSQHSLLQHIKTKAKTGAVRKIVSTVEETEAGNGQWGELGVLPDANVYRTSIRALLKKDRTDLAVQLYRLRMKARQSRSLHLSADLPLAASVIKAVLRDCKKRKLRALDSDDVFEEMRNDCIPFPVSQTGTEESESEGNRNVSGKVSALLSVMNTFLVDGDIQRSAEALDAISNLSSAGPHAAVPVVEYNNAIRHLGKSRSLAGVFAVLDLMRASKTEPNNETFEFIANSAVRQVEFVTGAVSMDTLPEPINAEVAFVGRSNVGKSSLVNMLCNRKALAYVSGTPGKTQQFNYFLVNGRDREMQFYMVDLPGVGYAKVPKTVQDVWLDFMRKYFAYRTSLRLVFHLVDGRHGTLVDDEALMKQIAMSGRKHGEYVIVLTKMDKMDKQKAKQAILNKTRQALVRNGCHADTPIVLTSSSTKLGREQMWRHLQVALAPVSKSERAAKR